MFSARLCLVDFSAELNKKSFIWTENSSLEVYDFWLVMNGFLIDLIIFNLFLNRRFRFKFQVCIENYRWLCDIEFQCMLFNDQYDTRHVLCVIFNVLYIQFMIIYTDWYLWNNYHLHQKINRFRNELHINTDEVVSAVEHSQTSDFERSVSQCLVWSLIHSWHSWILFVRSMRNSRSKTLIFRLILQLKN